MCQQFRSQFWTLSCSIAAIWLLSCSSVFAQSNQGRGNQFGSSFRNRPTVSPYLSTLDNGSGYGALNYYNIVKPQARARQNARRVDEELHQVERGAGNKQSPTGMSNDLKPITTGRMIPTGHSTTFGSVGNYFGSRGNGGGGAGGGGNDFGRNGKNR